MDRKHTPQSVEILAMLTFLSAGLLGGCPPRGERGRSFSMLHRSVSEGNLAEVKHWLREGSSVNARDKHGRTPLCIAAHYGRRDIVEVLLGYGADVNDGALTYAVAGSQLAVVELLLSKGASSGGDPLVQAAMDGNVALARMLLNNVADVDATGVDVVHGEPGVSATSTDGNTPLCIAAEYGRLEVAEMLLARGADVNRRSRYGYPLGCAAVQGHMEIVKLLLSRGAKPDARDQNGKSPAELAEEAGHADIAVIIRQVEQDSSATRMDGTS